jgi:Zn-dependent protease with chaperone function
MIVVGVENAIMRTPVCRLLLFLLFFVPLAASPAHAMSEEEEIQIGAQAAARFEAQSGVVRDPAYTGRLLRIAQRLLPHVERKDLPWRFTVVNVQEFNAAAFPGGFVYATRGIMDGLSDDELAFALGHEMGHVDKRHSIKQLESDQMRRLGLIAIAVGASGGRVSDTTATLVSLADSVISSQYSQADENEADRYGLTLMASAGYDPAFALSTLEKLASQSNGGTPGFLNTLLGSHPLTRDRIAQAVRMIPTVPYQATPLPPVGGDATSLPERPGPGVLLADAGRSLEYTLSLLGHGFHSNLQRSAERVALGQAEPPPGTRLLRFSGSRVAGLSALEDRILASSELRGGKRKFGAAVVDRGGDRIEAVLVLK